MLPPAVSTFFASGFVPNGAKNRPFIQLHRIPILLRRANCDSITIKPSIVVTNNPLNTHNYEI